MRRNRQLGAVPGVTLIVTALVALSACGGGPGGDTTPDDTARVALVLPFKGLAFMQNQEDGARAAAEDDGGIDLTVLAPPQLDGAAQAKLMTDAITAGAEGIVAQPIAPALFVRPFEDATRSGAEIATVTIRGADGTPGAYVGESGFATARQAATLVADRLGPDATGSIVLSTCGTGTPILDERNAGYRAELESRLPGVQIVGPVLTAQEAGNSLAAWESILDANPGALAYLGNCPFDGASLAKLKQSRGGDWLAGAFGIGPEIIDGLQSGGLLFSVEELEFARAYVATKLVADAVRGTRELPDGWIDTGSVLVTQANVTEAIERDRARGDARVALYRPYIEKALAATAQPVSDIAQ